jgi:hypothetical protein
VAGSGEAEKSVGNPFLKEFFDFMIFFIFLSIGSFPLKNFRLLSTSKAWAA